MQSSASSLCTRALRIPIEIRKRAEKSSTLSRIVARQGFEPRLNGPEPFVLPLDDLAVTKVIIQDLREKKSAEKF